MPSPLALRVRAWWQQFDHGQQISLSIFAPCAVLTMILAVVSLHASVVMPFRAPKALLQQSDQILAQQRALAAQNDQSATNKDTDGDGLSDYDEGRTFRTSAYLADTDSDGIADGEEVRRGTDPNCPPDRDCYGAGGEDVDTVPRVDATSVATSTAPTGAIEAPRPPDELTSAEIRAYLIRNQLASQEQLSPLSDAAVLELYRRAYADLEAAQSPRTDPAIGASTTATASPSPSDSSLSSSQPSTP